VVYKHQKNDQNGMTGTIAGIIMVLFLVFVVFWSIYDSHPPKPVSIEAPADVFSSGRAFVQVLFVS